ncbi:hypothetical protein LTR84_004033 [Exophiala bonariae]|uniref:Transcription factor domain-containing protein n=1 Tax=Exophiala bonariae TaxID=1690606 RepID=A0AAV9N5G1_9EURO|nr:hypothetical protein LTR84_004033 [Exophiala bonariae]
MLEIPASRPAGRKPGSRGRYQGVEKAFRKMQQELRKAKMGPNSDPESVRNASQLINDNEELVELMVPNIDASARPPPAPIGLDVQSGLSDRRSTLMADEYENEYSPTIRSPFEADISHAEPVTNPLGVVADACRETLTPNQASCSTTSSLPTNANLLVLSEIGEHEPNYQASSLLSRPGYISLGLKLDRTILEQALDVLLTRELLPCHYSDYFKPPGIARERDLGPHLDPVELGLLSILEAEHLFEVFFTRLHPINGILDPHLHSLTFVRSQSALLLTWMLATSAEFVHGAELLAKRLRNHGNFLSRHVHSSGYQSVEIVQGYYISMLSPTPSSNMADERTSLYTNHAFGLATELRLDKSRCRPNFGSQMASSSLEQDPLGDPVLISQQRLNINDTGAAHTERLTRNRERTWLRILLWERAHSAARGRLGGFPENELIRNIEKWHLHPLADPNDKYTCAFILLRRQLTVMLNEIQKQQQLHHRIRHWVKDLVDSTLHYWCQTWISSPEVQLSPSELISNMFLKYVHMHARLWIFSFALHSHIQIYKSPEHHSGTSSIREDCFEAAINCCETAIRDLTAVGEPLYPMLAPTWAMISYAAVLSLRLFPLLYGNRPGAEVELLALLTRLALLLEKAGTTPAHRSGIAALLGQHLFRILHVRAGGMKSNIGISTACQPPSQTEVSVVENTDLDFVAEVTQQNDNIPFHDIFAEFDTYLSMPFLPGDEGSMNQGFTAPLADWMSQGFGSML